MTEVAIIGAGVVGLATALHLAHDGHEVTLLDPNDPGSGCSYGNAGTIADYAVQPVGTPDVLRALPRLLFDKSSPFSIRRAAIPALAPWLMRFARQSLPAAAKANAVALAGLLQDAGARWRDMAREVGASDLLQHRGCLYLYHDKAALLAAQTDMDFRRGLGVSVDLLDETALAEMEPGLPQLAGAAYFGGAMFLSDPGAMMAQISRTVMGMGVRHLRQRVHTLQQGPNGVHLTGPGLDLHTRHVVIAAGAHSRDLARQAGDRAPLDTERGYHAEWDMQVPRLNRPACDTARGFYLCPMTGRLRVAGTVELGGLTAPVSQHRIEKLVQGARAFFPELPEPDRTWMGFRPSMPDSLPVIGPSKAGAQVIHAYGHGHLGVTLAPVTAAIVADTLAGRAQSIDIAPYRATRF
jgi:glycine/D-amino acid oxidase-like deaminating enzyme